ncbi:MAG TPA: hypothetical protein VFL57_00125 [Bryobacteraceae bacterium]|nr:hypothetical protein [Bryobacteraceae bacterium]
MSRSSLTMSVYMLAVFLSGAAVGALGHRLYTAQTVVATPDHDRPGRPSPEEFRRRYVQELQTRLDLDRDQLARLNVVLDETRDRMHAVKEKYKPEYEAVNARSRPEMKAAHDHQVAQIRALLKNDSQRQAYEQFLAERERRRRERDSDKFKH